MVLLLIVVAAKNLGNVGKDDSKNIGYLFGNGKKVLMQLGIIGRLCVYDLIGYDRVHRI